jgi:methylenetetrahydrofolate--tRNA-(uracil-5-)-methyltransferase
LSGVVDVAAPIAAPRASAHGSLVHYICNADTKHFQPANITFDLLEQLDEATKRKVRDKKLRHKIVCDRALAAWDEWLQQIAQPLGTS